MKSALFIGFLLLISDFVVADCGDAIDNVDDGPSLKEAFRCLNNKLSTSEIGGSNLPIGTIISSMLPPEAFERQYGRAWVLADGSRVANTSGYFNVTGNNRIPDLRGLFLRGVNGARADGKGDTLGENRDVGSYQDYATARPETPFSGSTNTTGEHTHTYDKARPYNSATGSHDRAKNSGNTGTTAASGEHSHSFVVTEGGDSETRPRNVSVYFYIKVN